MVIIERFTLTCDNESMKFHDAKQLVSFLESLLPYCWGRYITIKCEQVRL